MDIPTCGDIGLNNSSQISWPITVSNSWMIPSPKIALVCPVTFVIIGGKSNSSTTWSWKKVNHKQIEVLIYFLCYKNRNTYATKPPVKKHKQSVCGSAMIRDTVKILFPIPEYFLKQTNPVKSKM